GFSLVGSERGVTFQAGFGLALQLGPPTQGVTAVVMWRRGRLPARVASAGIGLFVIVFLQVGLGYTKQFWLHVPIGVGIFGGLIRQKSTVDTLWRATGEPS